MPWTGLHEKLLEALICKLQIERLGSVISRYRVGKPKTQVFFSWPSTEKLLQHIFDATITVAIILAWFL